MGFLTQDLRQAVRSLRRSPGFCLAVVVTIALGIGVNSAVFAVIHSVLLTPLAYRDPDRLVLLWERNNAKQRDHNVVNPQNYLDWRDRARSFSSLAALGWSTLTFTGESPEVVQGRQVTREFFDVLGVPPALGRTFSLSEMAPAGRKVIILSDGLWRRRFGADGGIVGRAVSVAGGTAEVIGVMPQTFQSMPLGDDGYYEPLRLDESDRTRHGRYTMVVGRLNAGVSLGQAQAEMTALSKSLEAEYPAFDAGWDVGVYPLAGEVVGSSGRVLWLLLGAVALVLLIACANVANLLLARAAARRQEVVVRAALGATRGRLIRLRVAESVALAVTGGALGLLLAEWSLDLLVGTAPPDVPRLAEIRLDGIVLAATAATSLAVGVAIGLVTALGSVGGGDAGVPAPTGRLTASRTAMRFKGGLIVAQMSLALVLLSGAGLLIRSIGRLSSIDPGFDPANVLTMTLDLPTATYPDGGRQSAFYDQLLARLRMLPAVEGASAVSFLPLTGPGAATSFTVVGRPEPLPGQAPTADIRIVDPNYFTTMRIPVERGRAFTGGDRENSPPVVVVTETLARDLFPTGEALGQRLSVSWSDPKAQPEIVGIVGDVRYHGLDGVVRPMIYYPMSQSPTGSMAIVVRERRPKVALVPEVRSVVRELNRDLPVTDVATMATWRSRSMSNRRYPMLLLAVFAGLALTLAAIGIYGVISYAVSQRTREIGVRIALGARPLDVFRRVIGAGIALALAGVLLGSVAGGLAAQALGKLLYGVPPTDPGTFLVVAALLVGVAAVACLAPARRAVGVDPAIALKAE
jgi:putative ABC transport system permease protein